MHKTIYRVFIICCLITIAGCDGATTIAGSPKNPVMSSEEITTFLDRLYMEKIQQSPQSMTYLGMRDRYGEWDDISDQAQDKRLEMTKQHLTLVSALDLSNADENSKLSVKMFIEQANQTIRADRWRYHSYPVSQMRGIHSTIPSFLINQHLITNREDAQAYIQRIVNASTLLEQLVIQLRARNRKGILPPTFVYPLVMDSIKNIIAGAPFEPGPDSVILADFKEKVNALEIEDSEKQQLISVAIAALEDYLGAGYRILYKYLEREQVKATSDHGVWKFPDGEEFYNFALRKTTTTDMTADEIHQLGLKEVSRIQSQMRKIKRRVKFDGTLREFFDFMREDPRFYYPDTAAGKQAYLDDATALIDNMKSRLGELFINKPKADLIVKAVEPFREASAGQAFYQRPAPDGSRPGIYFANLYKMRDMSKYNMEALAYHEGIPGHHMQLSIAQELENIPKFRLYGGYTVFSEGWGLYSEALPKEIGLFADPYSDFGRLSGELYRACRLVVDTGIHAKKWTREEAIDYMNRNVPHSENYNTRQIERYIVMPAQATAYKIGMIKIQELRRLAKQELGSRFDIRKFHDVVLKNGSVSLPILEDNVNSWIASQQQ
ncbi:DUF885 domain-containing protein [Porticoccaceae bacterium]|nr:DUF885 domain-containing protein [Porticoccaceae bacterium]MDB2343412.1 DUF885 domain-containing protein [Porticoccaceae bacterium]MDB2634642.1 DUF885 domain-containing protein [Porticoccaceae bacterium]MDB2664661.1 DUF885 domain-containing protein [Porticoccaceae bacterium]